MWDGALSLGGTEAPREGGCGDTAGHSWEPCPGPQLQLPGRSSRKALKTMPCQWAPWHLLASKWQKLGQERAGTSCLQRGLARQRLLLSNTFWQSKPVVGIWTAGNSSAAADLTHLQAALFPLPPIITPSLILVAQPQNSLPQC